MEPAVTDGHLIKQDDGTYPLTTPDMLIAFVDQLRQMREQLLCIIYYEGGGWGADVDVNIIACRMRMEDKHLRTPLRSLGALGFITGSNDKWWRVTTAGIIEAERIVAARRIPAG